MAVADSDSDQEPVIHRGLAGVHLDRSQVSAIDGKAGRLSYRGYAIESLVEHSTCEEVVFLLVHGRLPSARELQALSQDMKLARSLPREVEGLIDSLQAAHPMDVLRTVVSVLSLSDPDRADDSPPAVRRKTARLLSQCAVAVARHHALKSGRAPVAPRRELSHAANLLFMLTGSLDARRARILEEDFILHAEHGSNAASFVARVVASTEADFHAAIVGAIACFAGPLHGAAVEGVIAMVREIAEPGAVADHVRRQRSERRPVMGFGHRVYRTADPRSKILRAHVEMLSDQAGDHTYLQILERLIEEMKPYARHGVNVNDDLFGSVSYALLGIRDEFFTAVFALCRIAGWAAQILEQYENNILIRPLLLYSGPQERAYVRLADRAQPPQETGQAARRPETHASTLGSE